jgi:hypothetical protein
MGKKVLRANASRSSAEPLSGVAIRPRVTPAPKRKRPLKPSVSDMAVTLVEFSESHCALPLSVEQAKRMRAIQAAADQDPKTYLKACRANAR